MMKKILIGLSGLFFLLAAFGASAQDSARRQVEALPWQSAPSIGRIGTQAQISLQGDLRFLDSANSSKFLELNGNPPRRDNYVLAPKNLDWFAVFAFEQTGYIKDDEKLEAGELLRVLKEQNEKGAEERKRLSLPGLRLTGWAVEPHYDLQTRRLEWGTQLVGDDGVALTNYTIRILGRSGVMRVILVSDDQSLKADIVALRKALLGFDFVPGERYAEFKQGDKTAEYGLAGLIIGGAAAAAAKTGALKGFGKLIGVGVIAALAAVGAWLRSIFRRKQ